MTRTDVIAWACAQAAPGVEVSPLRGACPGIIIDHGQIRLRLHLLKSAGAQTVEALKEHWPHVFRTEVAV